MNSTDDTRIFPDETDQNEEGKIFPDEETLKPGRINGKNVTLPKEVSRTHIHKRLKNEIYEVLKKNKFRHAFKDKNTGAKTQEIRTSGVYKFFRVLIFCGYNIQKIKNLNQKHLKVVFYYLEELGQLPKTLSGNISSMRIFCGWIGKAGMVTKSTDYVRDPKSVKCTMVAQADLSWSGNKVDPLQILANIRAIENGKHEWVAVCLELCWAFGLRIQEAVMMMPAESDHEGETVYLERGAKGNRHRIVPIENDLQHSAIQKAKSIMDKKTGMLGERGKSTKANIQHIYAVMRRVGITKAKLKVTVHGLRHEYAQQQHKVMTGVDAPIKGGDISSIPRDEYKYRMLIVMEKLGHSRVNIGASYYGSRRPRKKF